MIKECLGYCRDSKREWENIYSVEQQREAIQKYTLENNLHVLEIFEDVNKYGKKFNREALCGMLKYISLNPNVRFIVVSDVSRLFIKFNSSWFTLKRFLEEHNVELISLVNVMNKYIHIKK